MRFLVALFCLCGTVAGFAGESAPEEVVVADDEGSDEVAVATDSQKDKGDNGGCGCGGKPKL